MPTTTPYQAIVARDSGRVSDVIVCDQATATMFADWDLFPGCDWHDVTTVRPRPAPGWTWATGRTPEFRPPAPGPDWTWNEDTDSWDAPPPPPDPEPEPEPDPEPEADPEPTPDPDPEPTPDPDLEPTPGSTEG